MSYPNEIIKTSLNQTHKNQSDEESIDCLGAQVQHLRKARGWSLDQASQHIGLSRSALAKVEKAQMSPTFDAIKKIASGFEISVTQLLAPLPDEPSVIGRWSVTRNQEGEINQCRTENQEFLASDILDKQMLPYKGRIQARSIDDMDQWTRHDGQEFMLVLSGQVKFCTEFYKPTELSVGDSVYFDAKMGHFAYTISDEEAEVLWVMMA